MDCLCPQAAASLARLQLEHQAQRLRSEINEMVDAFDDALTTLRREKFSLESQIKMGEITLLVHAQVSVEVKRFYSCKIPAFMPQCPGQLMPLQLLPGEKAAAAAAGVFQPPVDFLARLGCSWPCCVQELALLRDFDKREVVFIEKRTSKMVDRNVSGGEEQLPGRVCDTSFAP